ncbi:MAG: AraC family transcriptional regulator ligand-binding domain-containing protein [Myxococcales bacterium]
MSNVEAVEHHLSLAFARGLIEAVEALGISQEELLRDTPLTEAGLAVKGATQPLHELDKLVERALVLTGDPALGLRWWDRATFSAFGAVGSALAVAENYRAALELVARYWPLYSNVELFSLCDESDVCRLTMIHHSGSALAHRVYMESVAFVLRRLLRQHAGLSSVPRCISFDFPAPPHAHLYERVLDCQVIFDAPATEIVVEQAHALRPQPNYVPELEAHLTAFADELMQQRGIDALASKVLKLLRATADAHRTTMEDAAEQLGMSERTLRRRLQLEGTSYPVLVQRVQREVAEALLLDRTRSVKEIANVLGFANSRGFHRAVQRWTGRSPTALRGTHSSHPSSAKAAR